MMTIRSDCIFSIAMAGHQGQMWMRLYLCGFNRRSCVFGEYGGKFLLFGTLGVVGHGGEDAGRRLQMGIREDRGC